MAKPELGTKRLCPSCGTKYYDLQKNPITCPNCGTVFEIAARERAPLRAVAPVAAAVVADEEEVEEVADGDAELVSLEEVEEDADEVEGDPALDVDEEAAPEVETLDVEGEIEPEEADPFLEEEEEQGDDVAGLLDVEGEDEDEV